MRPGKCAYLVGVATVLALVAVWQSRLLVQKGYRLQQIRAEIRRQEVLARIYSAQTSQLKSPQRIAHLVDTLSLGLIHPDPPAQPVEVAATAAGGEDRALPGLP